MLPESSGSLYWEMIADEIKAEGWSVGWVRAYFGNAPLWSVDANKGDGRKFIAQAEELAVAMLELQKMLPTGEARAALACNLAGSYSVSAEVELGIATSQHKKILTP